MNSEQIISEIKRYESELAKILSRFTQDRDGIHIGRGDDPLLTQYVRELMDFLAATVTLSRLPPSLIPESPIILVLLRTKVLKISFPLCAQQ